MDPNFRGKSRGIDPPFGGPPNPITGGEGRLKTGGEPQIKSSGG
jgi:hypothetical protein